MEKIPLEIVIPVYNEGSKIVELFESFNKHVKTQFRILICYDNDDDDVFKYTKELKKFSFETLFVKNPGKGPCLAVKEGLYFGN